MHMLPRLDSILKVNRCKCKTVTDAACAKRCSCQKNKLFCVIACGQCQGEGCSNESKSLIKDDIDGYHDRNVFDALQVFVNYDRLFYCFIYQLNLSKTMLIVVIPYQVFSI